MRRNQYLYMRRNQLKGPFPQQLQSLSQLEVMDISHNSFSGSIPRNLDFPFLTELRLQNNEFMGSVSHEGGVKKKRVKAGESRRPKPKDRQMIQDHIKELRGMIPNGSKFRRAAKKKDPKTRWKIPEEKALVSAWLNTSKDPIVATRQKRGAFWQRVADYYASCPDVVNLQKRTADVCKQKWRKLSESVSKFCGCYDYATRNKKSGNDDLVAVAYELYYADQKVKFSLEHAWRMLRSDQKWCTFISKGTEQKTKKSKLIDGSSSNTASNVEEDIQERPMGVKAAKAKENKRGQGKIEEAKGAGSLKVLSQVWEIKDKDNAAQKMLSNQKILEGLLAKPGVLSEMEVNLKNTLMSDMLKRLGKNPVEEGQG